jgi:hypothetical protein
VCLTHEFDYIRGSNWRLPYAGSKMVFLALYELFKNKAHRFAPAGLVFEYWWWRARNRCATSLSQTNRRAFAPGGAKSLAGALLRSSKPLLAPRPCRPWIQCPLSGMRYSKNKAPPACAGRALFRNTGGGGGNRTLVRKHSTDSSTYLALSINLTGTTGMCTLCTSELP